MQQQLQKRQNKKAYQKLSEKDKKILQAIKKTNKNQRGTPQEIATTYNELNTDKIQPDDLHEKLSNLEEVGLTKQAVTNENDQPILKWKSNISLPQLSEEKLANPETLILGILIGIKQRLKSVTSRFHRQITKEKHNQN